MGLLITVSGPANNDTTPIDWCAILCPSNDPDGPDWCADCTPPPPPPPLPTHSKISVPLKISLVILVVTFSLFLLYTLFKFYSVWHRTSRRRSPASDPDPENPRTDHAFLDQDLGPVIDHPIWYIRTVGLQPSVINSITVIKFKKGEGIVDGTDCSVCLSEFEDGESLRLLPACNHAFHLPCIDTWLSSHTNCPLCRAGIEQVVLDASSSSAGSSGGETLEGSSGESGGTELRIRVDEEVDDVFPKSGVSGVELAVVRRSVSLDSSVASRISFAVNAAMAKNSDQSDGARMVGTEETDPGVVQRSVDVDQQNLVGLAGSSRTLQRGPNFIRRSFSCSGKVLPSRRSGGEDSVPPS